MKFQRLFSILLCVCLAIACCTSAFAESPHFDSSAPEASLNVSVNSGDKIYVAVAHDYDGDTATGRVSVRHG